MEIIYAGYGIHNATFDVTAQVRQAYIGGQRKFLANNQWGDPAPGHHKSLFIVWRVDGGDPNSGVVPEGDNQGIWLPNSNVPQPPPPVGN